MSNFKACIFDLNGVLCNTQELHYLTWKRLANEVLGFDFTSRQNDKIKGLGRKDTLDILLSWGKFSKDEVEKATLLELKNSWFLELIEDLCPDKILAGAKQCLLDARNAGMKVGLASASKNARLIINKLEIDHLFDAVVDGSNTEKSKPDPDVFLKVSELLQVEPKKCFVFEDSEEGLKAAHRANMFAVGVGQPESLQRANIVISSLEDVNFAEILDLLSITVE